MSNIDNIKWTIPENGDRNWYETFKSLVEMEAASAYAAREDRSLAVYGGGTLDLNVNTFSWSAALSIASPLAGYKFTVAAGSVTIQSGQWLYIEVTRNPLVNATLTMKVANTLPNDDNAVALGVRDGSAVYFRPLWSAIT